MIRIDRIYTDTHDSVHDRPTSSFDDKVLYEKLWEKCDRNPKYMVRCIML